MRLGRQRRPQQVGSPLRVPASKNALTAAGARVGRKDADAVRRLIQPWQSRSFAYYDLLGEINFASQFYSRALSQLRLYAAEKDDSGEFIETAQPDAVDALARIQDPGGGRSMLLSNYGRLMFLVGETYLFVTRDPETGEEQWEMLSTDELRVQSGVYLRYKAPSLAAEEYHEVTDDPNDPAYWVPVDDREAVAYRIWQRHPRFSMLATSTMQGVLDVAEELVILTHAVRARARSRMAGSGFLFIDDRISPAPPQPAPDEDPEEDVFVADIIEAITKPITDEGAASAVAPIIIRVPVPPDGTMDVSKMVYHLQILDPSQLYPETGLRMECIKRMAIGLDMPPEILTGLTEATHWSAWAVDENVWKHHLQPKAQQLVDDLNQSFFRPFLREAGVQGWERYYIAYDAAAIINHPDRGKDASDLHDRGALSDAALRDAKGFDDADAPSDEERDWWLGAKIRDGSLAKFGIPSLKSGGIEPVAGEVESPAGTSDVAVPAAVSPGPPPKGPPEAAASGLTGATRAAHVLGAAELALLRAREAAGNRLLSLARRDPEAAEKIRGVRNTQVAATLGQQTVRRLRAPSEPELVAGARPLIEDALRMFGITDPELVAIITDGIEKHAARTLYEVAPSRLPPAFHTYVAGLLTGK